MVERFYEHKDGDQKEEEWDKQDGGKLKQLRDAIGDAGVCEVLARGVQHETAKEEYSQNKAERSADIRSDIMSMREYGRGISSQRGRNERPPCTHERARPYEDQKG